MWPLVSVHNAREQVVSVENTDLGPSKVLYLVPCLAIACLGSYTRNNPYSWPPSWTDFKDPPVQVRPRFRYWLPDASVEVGPAVQDVARAKQVGAGGLEVLGFYGYETTPGQFVPVDWTTYNWGGDAWRKCPVITLGKPRVLNQAHNRYPLQVTSASPSRKRPSDGFRSRSFDGSGRSSRLGQ